MITDCPACHRQFRIYARQLTAAQGLVQCGYCGQHFNALDRLHDLPIRQSHVQSSVESESDEDNAPQFEIPASDSIKEQLKDADYEPPGDEVTTHSEIQPVPDIDEPGELLEETDPVAASRAGIAGWAIGFFLLLAAISAQLVWFNRDTILSEYPQFLPVSRKICEHLHCELIREQDISSVVLVNRDVRDHPRFNNMLLINATIENKSTHIQPYPLIQLILYDTDGIITGYRQFNPAEYLDEAVQTEDGMMPAVPVHIIMELTGSTETAVSFEFRFLQGK